MELGFKTSRLKIYILPVGSKVEYKLDTRLCVNPIKKKKKCQPNFGSTTVRKKGKFQEQGALYVKS